MRLKIYKEKISPPYSNDIFTHWAYWDNLKAKQERLSLEGCDDVRAAGGVLDMLKIPNKEVFAWEEDNGKDDGWRIAWK